MFSWLLLVPGLVVTSNRMIAARAGRTVCVEQATTMPEHLLDPSVRDQHYGNNIAKYLVDLHDASATFDFCGGMMFQLVLSDALRSHLAEVAAAGEEGKQVTVHDAATPRMALMPGYTREAAADNLSIFHGREVRKVPDAEGGMGFVLHLSLANGPDTEGWTPQEVAGYDGWGHDSQRQWRNRAMLESEGFETFGAKFGASAFTLHHRFYLHLDPQDRLWLSAEDGCEGTPGVPQRGFLRQLLGA